MADTIQIFLALKLTWDQTQPAGLVPFGTRIFNTDPPAGTIRPYLILAPLSEAPLTFTNKSQYDEGSFECHIIADNCEDDPTSGSLGAGEGLIQRLEESLKPLTLTLGGGLVLKRFRPGSVRYIEEQHYWRVTQEWHFLVGKPK